MSLKNYIFTSINIKPLDAEDFANNFTIRVKKQRDTRKLSQIGEAMEHEAKLSQTQTASNDLPSHQPPTASNFDRIRRTISATDDIGWFKKIMKLWSYISVEPVMVCWLLPSCLLLIAIENLALEKSCRVNFGYRKDICDNMIDKTISGIDCVFVRERLHNEGEIHLDPGLLNSTNFITNGTEMYFENGTRVFFDIPELHREVCHAEIDSQKLDTQLNIWTAPFDSVFGILMILFAGGWSDKRGLRKPCMLLPLFGELAALLAYLVATVFFNQLPLEFSSVLGQLLPAITGGANLMQMGVYSYLAEMTAVEDRTFRFGIFAVIVPLIPIVSLPLSGILFQKLRYIKLILICIPINLIGILYVIFILQEVKPHNPDGHRQHGADNDGFDTVTTSVPTTRRIGRQLSISSQQPEKRPCLVDFFNPIVAINCIKVIGKKRLYNARRVLVLMLILYFIATGPAFGEEPNEYNFTRIKLNWGGLSYSPYATYGNAISLAGTMFMIGGLSKLFHLTDPLVGLLGTVFSSASKVMNAVAKTDTDIYVAKTLDMFINVRALTIKSTISAFVEVEELGRIFSIIGILEAFGKFVFVSLYSIIYEETLETWPSAFYLCSLVCLIITAFLFIILYFIVKRKQKRDRRIKEELENATPATTDNTGDTHM